jgi:hypothetical protein
LRKLMMLTAMVAMVLALTAGPAFATTEKVTICHKPGTPAEKTMEVPAQAVDGHLGHGDTLGECSGEPGPGPDPDPDPDDGKNGKNGDNGKNGNDGDGGDNFFGLEQDNEQSADSGNITQQVSIGGGNDNSNICVSPQLIGNTGNAQSQNNLLTAGSSGDVELEETGSTLNVGGSNETTCNQSVDQTAVAY